MNKLGYPNQSNCIVYTYHLPYRTREDICNLLDADQSWRTLGGQYMGLNATQLTLISQAYMRNGSPTEELLNKLDSANIRIVEFCFYLKQMNHYRALEILKPFLGEGDLSISSSKPYSLNDISMSHSKDTTLDTPTPSFIEQPAAIMGCNDLNPFEIQQNWVSPDELAANLFEKETTLNGCRDSLPSKCHKSNSVELNVKETQSGDHRKENDPGEEIVRMACANNRKRTSISDQEVVNQLRLIMQINYNELKQASSNFSNSNILGNGGFASVYRGNWKGTDVAIKRLKCNLMDQALNELTILNSYRIDNILPIYGISIDGPEACLVYQFMANGSLEERLACKRGTPPLTWPQRALIGEGVAKGLFYLHTLRDKPLVHGDVKSANVLLDSQFVPKLGDFGLARQVFKASNPQTELCTHCTVSSIHGTSVYLPPEYLRHKILSSAVDVYSYGIVLLEMATGKRAYDGKRLLIDLVEDEMRQVNYNLKDPRLIDDTREDLKIWHELLIMLGLNCAHKIKKKRPDMGQVLTRFSEFRSASEWSSSGFNSTTQGIASPIGSTTRTLTPDLTTLGKRQHLLIGNANSTKQESGNKELQCRPETLRDGLSALMSVEEEPTIPHYELFEQSQADQSSAAVEAMIPLLTELGVVTNHD